MTTTPSREVIAARVIAVVREKFLSGDPEGELTEDTPLIEYGVLNSLGIAVLIGWAHDEFGVPVPPGKAGAGMFESVATISATLSDLVGEYGTATANRSAERISE